MLKAAISFLTGTVAFYQLNFSVLPTELFHLFDSAMRADVVLRPLAKD